MEENVLTFYKPAHTGAGEFYIDLAESASIVNRKLKRQMGLHSVLGLSVFVEDTVTGLGVEYNVAVSGAPRTWMTRNALVKAYHAWLDQQERALDSTSESIKPRWQDFKVWLNNDMRTGTVLTPTSGHMFGGLDPYIAGEWVHSKIVIESADAAGLVQEYEPELHILGADNGWTSKGLIQQYSMSRALPQAPDPSLPANVEHNIFSQSVDPLANQVIEVIANMEDDNNEPPYSRVEYTGADQNGTEPLLYAYATNSTTLKRRINMNGFTVPNGLLEFQLAVTPGHPNPVDVYVQIVVGETRDY